MPRVDIGELKLHYQQAGEGPDVVLLHGFTSNLAMWMFSEIVERLAQSFRVTMYDLRGHGRSDAPSTGYTSHTMADDFFALCDVLKLKPAYLVGHSFGGVVAFHAAVREPDRVAGIVLSDTYFPGLSELEPDMQHAEVWTNLSKALGKAGAEIGDSVDFDRLFRVIAALDERQMGIVKEELGAPGARWLSQITALVETTAATETFQEAGLGREEIASVRQPVVAIYDEHSPFTRTRDFLQENLEDCIVDSVPKARHLAMLENPTAFVEIVDGHLRRMAGIASVR